MKTCNIKLTTIRDVQKFIRIVCQYDFEIDLTSGRYTVDAKSIMGIFSLDLLNPIGIVAHTESEEEWAKFTGEIREFLA
ncbi:MAG: HPr family phosphocarrier protein [Clostridia bacterium]|nr:HPr family phosphocarrier protein [Clostridia bacterium]